MKSAPVCNHELSLPPSTTLADALHAYRDFKKPLSFEPSYFAHQQGIGAPWYARFAMREAELAKLAREQAADLARDAKVMVPAGEFRRALEDAMPLVAKRRTVEHTVARRLKECALHPATDPRAARDMDQLAESMFLCRCDGHAGEADGDLRFSWLHKCDSTRLCPDGAREHSMWEAQRYAETMLEHVSRGSTYRAHQLVFTVPSAPLGQMVPAIDALWDRFRAFLDFQRRCKDKHRAKYGWSKRKRKIAQWQPGQRTKGAPYDGPGIHGALVQLECHLTAAGAWHPHLNVIVLTKGRFDYRMVRKVWGYNVGCQPIKPDEHGFAGAFRELIKYAARHVGEKTESKADQAERDKREAAPPLTDWPLPALAEWYAATRAETEGEGGAVRIQGARWLRSYGSLHGIAPPELQDQDVTWLTRVTFTDLGCFYVGSIPGSKFQDSALTAHLPGYRVPTIRPPPRPLRPPGEP